MDSIRIVVSAVMLTAVTLLAVPAQAQGFPAATREVVTWSARACYAEATWSHEDCAALLHVIRKRSQRFGWNFLTMLRRYSVVNWIKSPQGQHVASLGLTPHRDHDRTWNERWHRLIDHVVDVLNARVDDPCPEADHWAAKWYTPRTKMQRARCAVRLQNAFWVER